MQNELSISACLLADDATSADQLALAVCETSGGRVITTDAATFAQEPLPLDRSGVWVINTGTRALSESEAHAANQRLASGLVARERHLPLLQIDSRLRGVGRALRGLYEALEFDVLLFVPAEPELGRLASNGVYYHVEDGKHVEFHQSTLATAGERGPSSSQLREFVAGELGISADHVISIGNAVMSGGTNVVADSLRHIVGRGKVVVIPDVTAPEHFETIISVMHSAMVGRASLRAQTSSGGSSIQGSHSPSQGAFAGRRILVAGSRTFLRSYLQALAPRSKPGFGEPSLSQAIDRRRRGAPLAIACSLEPATTAQVGFAREAIGPNLVAVVFNSSALLAGEAGILAEVERVRGIIRQSLKAMRPVLLQSTRAEAAPNAIIRQTLPNAIGRVLSSENLLQHVTALFVTGGHTAEAVRSALRVSAVEINGAFEPDIPWGVPVAGPLKHIPIITKGGRMGREAVLYDFLEQTHPLPRANILPVITPLTHEKAIDEGGIEKLIDYLLGLGTTDIFAVGNAGEFRFLSNRQRLQALEIFARKAQGKLRVFAGVTGDSAQETRSNYEAAGRLGVFAAVVMPLYFLESSEEIVPFVESLAATGSRLPLVLYNNAERTRGQNISFDAVEAVPFPVVGIKDSSGDLARLGRYASVMPVYEGQQRQFLEGYVHGARGSIGIIGHATSLPNEFYAPPATAHRRQEIARAINELSKTIKQGGAEVAAYKFLLSLIGVTGDTVASSEPARELTPAQRESIRQTNAELVLTARSRLSGNSPTHVSNNSG